LAIRVVAPPQTQGQNGVGPHGQDGETPAAPAGGDRGGRALLKGAGTSSLCSADVAREVLKGKRARC
jgi:hypothetical protein